jgi:preprotein translocase subunit SecG
MWLNILIYAVLTCFVLVCLLLLLAVLMQRSKQDGIGATFGSGATESVFGAQTSSVLVKFTAWLIGAFFILAIVLAVLYGQLTPTKSVLSDKIKAGAAASESAAATEGVGGVTTKTIPVEPAPEPNAEVPPAVPPKK